MSYISKHLHAKEKIVHRGRFHWMEYITAWSALVFLGIFIIGIVIFLRILVKVMTTEFSITSQRIIVKRGLIAPMSTRWRWTVSRAPMSNKAFSGVF